MNKRWIGCFVTVGLVLLSLSIGSNDAFSWQALFRGKSQAWQLFVESRLPRTLAIVMTSGAISLAGLLMQTITQNPYAAPSTTGTTEASQLGILVSLFLFPKATLFQKMSLAFCSALLFTGVFLLVLRRMQFKEKWMLPLVGMIYSGIIGALGQALAYHFHLIQSMTSWSQGSFSMIQRNQYEWLFLTLLVFLGIWLYSESFSIMSLGEETSRILGLPYAALESFALALVALTSAVTMITVGSLPFLGVIVPNIVRQISGDYFKKIRLQIVFLGINIVLFCDILARLVIRPYEVSVSLILGVLGALAFLGMIWKGAEA
ncbi:ABC transporter permease [Streptococcus sp. DD13]|uniref:ABC transporter permease n=1 Tax=Streptococcus sp. DD13 TaxID=1777881 RepID=UPI000799F470|nr:iron chelate uptake ABC transporter family permease subunit [Streptococcus sp. DD13]KXT77357.1 Iron compound ABC uptake transporter permease protein PiuB [Streptococcus sp. DD13]